jgi:chromosome segregation ATPase
MDMEQVIKQVDWLDEERRRDKTRLGSIEERINSIEENIAPFASQIKDLQGELSRLSAVTTRMNQFDENMLKQRVETKKYFDELDRLIQKSHDESENVHRMEIAELEEEISETQKQLDAIPNIQRRIDARIEEENRLARSIDELRAKIDEIRRSDEEYTRTIRLLDDGRRQDTKKLTDLQGEVTTIRKRVDQHRGEIELNSVAVNKIETRINELSVIEAERRQAQEKFLENQSLRNVERDRTWKEWQGRFEQIEQQTMEIETNLQALENTHRDIKRTQQTVDDLSQKLERRINEITEIQRLSEERFRQEWVTFKSDDQKRWTNYTLTQDEQRSETTRQVDKLAEKITLLEDAFQDLSDTLIQVRELTQKRLQSLRAAVHDWVSEYERSLGSGRP